MFCRYVIVCRLVVPACGHIISRLAPPPKYMVVDVDVDVFEDGSPLPLGEQLCGHRQPQVLPAVHLLRFGHIGLRPPSRDRAIHGLRKELLQLWQRF